ncbi:MAG: AbrB/MazE/SpoVT family DNA-binding domain-containing protein [Oscillospiraceae bacterium]|nr:AbrB/MazE/SpoVT family DNA-binding domain-containing protein [Oscillospiraceae bacterium]
MFMKATGIVRRVDELGRVVLPIELRNKFGITEKDPMEIYVEGSSIILKKYEPNCIFCGGSKGLFSHSGKMICKKCGTKITTLNQD